MKKNLLFLILISVVILSGIAVFAWQSNLANLNSQGFSLQPQEVLAEASDPTSVWYVRPKKTGLYGNGNGLSYENAFNGYGNGGGGIIWGEAGVHAGDTLYICDTHHDTTIPFDVFASGTAENVITIRGDYPNHPAIMTFGNPMDGIAIHINNSYITYKNIAFNHFGCSPWFDTVNSTHITFDGCVFRDSSGGYAFFGLGVGNDYWLFNNCDMADAQNGIYTYHEGNLSANYLTVKNSKFDNIGNAPWTDGDGHAVGIQGGIGHVIEGNYFNNTGAAIQFYASPTESINMGASTIRYNFIKNTTSGAMGAGISVLDLTEGATGGDKNYIIEYNITLNTYGPGIYFGTIENRPFKIRNNTIMTTGAGYGYGIGIVNSANDTAGEIYNNIVVNPSSAFIRIISMSGYGSLANVKIDNNLYFSSIGAKTWFGYPTFEAYKTGTGFDTNGINANPQFVSANPLAPEDFKLKSTSPAIDKGFDWSNGQTKDYFGNPLQGTPDIGAIEFQSTQIPNITLTKTVDKVQAVQSDKLTYTITYNNNGEGEAKDVIITDNIPAGAVYVGNSASNGGVLNGNTLSWTIASIPAGVSGSVSFKVKL